jgi:hypothetical protein
MSAEEIELVPVEVTTVMFWFGGIWAIPGNKAGTTAVISVGETTVKLVALVVPNRTSVTWTNPVPVIVMVVPAGPFVGLMLVTSSGETTTTDGAAELLPPLHPVSVNAVNGANRASDAKQNRLAGPDAKIMFSEFLHEEKMAS